MAEWTRCEDDGGRRVAMDRQSGLRYGREPNGRWWMRPSWGYWNETRVKRVPYVVQKMLREAPDA